MKSVLIELGVREDKVIVEGESRNTRDQAFVIANQLEAMGYPKFVLVTSDSHLRRASLAFLQVGTDPLLIAAENETDNSNWQVSRWLPSWDALNASHAALREYLALVYYWSRGWISLPY